MGNQPAVLHRLPTVMAYNMEFDTRNNSSKEEQRQHSFYTNFTLHPFPKRRHLEVSIGYKEHSMRTSFDALSASYASIDILKCRMLVPQEPYDGWRLAERCSDNIFRNDKTIPRKYNSRLDGRNPLEHD